MRVILCYFGRSWLIGMAQALFMKGYRYVAITVLRMRKWAVPATALAILCVPSMMTVSGHWGVRAESSNAIQDSRSLLGSYLSGRHARSSRDNHTAAGYYKQALNRDPGNQTILRQAFILELSAGNWMRANRLARKIAKFDGGHRIAHLFLALSSFKEGKLGEAEANLEKASVGPIGQLTGALLQAWIKQARGDTKAAYASLDRLKKIEWTKFYRQYHHALIADVAGQTEVAGREYSRIFRKEPGTLRVALAYARHLASQGKIKRAKSVVSQHYKSSSVQHPMARDLMESLEKKEQGSLLIGSANFGVAEVFYGLGEALSNDDSLDVGLIYLQLALYIQPEFPLALAALANVYEMTKQNERAIQTYAQIDKVTPISLNAQIRRAYNLNLLDRVEEAKGVLEDLIKEYPNEIRPLDALGNIMRSHKRYEEAVVYYDRAIGLIKKPSRRHWSHYYSRGVSYERLKNWAAAEDDLELALKLNGDEPKILNYLGYSWVDQNIKLKRAMSLIRKAVKLKPDDGYYVDSLGWAYYRLGNYKAAVKYLERAVELRSDDPVINDHLGDAMWRVNRRLEARFQWQQSLALGPEKADIPKIKRKLLSGLPEPKRARVTKKRRRAEKRSPNAVEKNDFQPFSQF